VSQVRTFFRHCPSCRRRFEIRLVSKNIGESERFEEKDRLTKPATTVSGWPPISSLTMPPSIVEESIPLTVDESVFQYMYRCKHCGHQWLEFREVGKVVPQPKGYTGD